MSLSVTWAWLLITVIIYQKMQDNTYLHYFLPQDTVVNMVIVEEIDFLMVVSQQLPLHC